MLSDRSTCTNELDLVCPVPKSQLPVSTRDSSADETAVEPASSEVPSEPTNVELDGDFKSGAAEGKCGRGRPLKGPRGRGRGRPRKQ